MCVSGCCHGWSILTAYLHVHVVTMWCLIAYWSQQVKLSLSAHQYPLFPWVDFLVFDCGISYHTDCGPIYITDNGSYPCCLKPSKVYIPMCWWIYVLPSSPPLPLPQYTGPILPAVRVRVRKDYSGDYTITSAFIGVANPQCSGSPAQGSPSSVYRLY